MAQSHHRLIRGGVAELPLVLANIQAHRVVQAAPNARNASRSRPVSMD